MNREIKFRVWDKVDKFFYQALIGMSFDETPLACTFLSSLGDIKTVSTEHLEITQFTGLKDKNDKEIYEGDIVQRTSGETEYGVVRWTGHGFWIVEPSGSRFMPLPERMKVVGNIFETPELVP